MTKRQLILLLCGAIVFFGITVTVKAGTVYKGYIMCASGSTAYLLDTAGKKVHSWAADENIRNQAYLLPDGSVVCGIQHCNSPSIDGAYPGGRFQKIDKDNNVTWDYSFCPDSACCEYDIEPLPNGNILVPADASGSSGLSMIYEIQPSGTSGGSVVWSCRLPDSLGQICNSSGGGFGGGGCTYVNSVKYNKDLDRIVIDMNTPAMRLVVIDHSVSGGKILYTYKVSSSHQSGGTTNYRVHAANWSTKYYLGTDSIIPNADTSAMRLNNIMVVYNGAGKIVEVNPTKNTLVKSISYSFASNEGSVQHLPNGNWFVAKGINSNVIAELDSTGTSLQTYTAPTSHMVGGGGIQRAYKYGMSYAGLKALGITTSIEEQKQEASVRKINTGKFTYNASANTGDFSMANSSGSQIVLQIFSVGGKKIYSAKTNTEHIFFSTEKMMPGIYYIKVNHTTGNYATRIVKMM